MAALSLQNLYTGAEELEEELDSEEAGDGGR